MEWAEVPDPVAGPGEVLIDVVASAVNRADLLQRQGHYPPPPGASEILGLECAGRIAALGEGVTGWSVGDEVCALLAGGGYAQKVAVPAAQVLPVPAGVDLVDGRRAARGRVHRLVQRRGDRTAAGGRDVPRPGRQQRHRHPRDPGREGAGRPGGRDRGAAAGRPVPRAGRRHRHRLPRRRPRAAQEGDRRARRRRHPRQHGREGPGRERRRARRRRPAAGHRHAGRDEGRARPQHAAPQAGAASPR